MCTHFSAQPKLNSPAFKQTTITCKGKEREREKKRKNDLTVKLPVVILLTREQCLLLPGVALQKFQKIPRTSAKQRCWPTHCISTKKRTSHRCILTNFLSLSEKEFVRVPVDVCFWIGNFCEPGLQLLAINIYFQCWYQKDFDSLSLWYFRASNNNNNNNNNNSNNNHNNNKQCNTSGICSPPPFLQCWWVCKLGWDHAADKLLVQNIY